MRPSRWGLYSSSAISKPAWSMKRISTSRSPSNGTVSIRHSSAPLIMRRPALISLSRAMLCSTWALPVSCFNRSSAASDNGLATASRRVPSCKGGNGSMRHCTQASTLTGNPPLRR
ncbi:hypothetical protein D3C81_1805430 [compost metagenome]